MTAQGEARGELLPCPFCGGDSLGHGYEDPPGRGNVLCGDCDACIVAEDESAAIAAWNRRPEHTSPPVETDAMNWAKRYAHAKAEVERIGHMQSTDATEAAYEAAKEDLAVATAHLPSLVPALLSLAASPPVEAVEAARRIILWVEISGEGPADAWPTTCGDAIAIARALISSSGEKI